MARAARSQTWGSPLEITRTKAASRSASSVFSDDYKILFQNDGHGNFNDVSFDAGIAQPSFPFVGFGDAFLDYDNDGWKDLMFINGHVYPDADKNPDWGMSYAQRPLLFRNLATESSTWFPLSKARDWRSPPWAAAQHLVISSMTARSMSSSILDGTPHLLRNVNPDTHHWVELKLVGGPKVPGCRGGHRLSHCGRHAPARRRDQRRQLPVKQRHASSLRIG